jgi:cyanate permease
MGSKLRYSRFALWPLAVAVALEASLYSALTPLLPSLRRSMELDLTATGALFSTWVMGTLIGAAIGPWMQTRASTRAVVRVSLCVIAATGLAFALSDSLIPAGAFRLIGGTAGGLVWSTCLGGRSEHRYQGDAAPQSVS